MRSSSRLPDGALPSLRCCHLAHSTGERSKGPTRRSTFSNGGWQRSTSSEGTDMQLYKIVIAGEGGQGVQSIAKIVAQAAFDQGKKAVYVPYFSTEKRGGTTEAYAQVGDTVPAYPKFAKADLWAVLSERAIERIYPYLKDDTKVIVNSFLVKDVSKIKDWDPLEINA